MKLFTKIITIGLVSFAMSATINVAFSEETPQVRALNLRISFEVNTNLQCTTFALDLQDKLATAQVEIKRMADKYEPKPDEQKK